MKKKKIISLAILTAAVFGISLFKISTSTLSANENDISYTIDDIRNLQDFLLAKETPDLSGKDYDLYKDGVWNVFDLCMMKRKYLKSQNQDNSAKNLVAYFAYSENVGDTSGMEADAVASASLNQKTANQEGNLQIMAQEISKFTSGNMYSIHKTTPYAFNYSDMLETALQEQSNNIEVELNLSDIPDLSDYDTIYLGTPVWAGSLPQPMVTFLRNNDLSGKKIIVFGIHLGSGFGRNINQIKELFPDSEVVEGITINAATSNEDTRVKIQEWLS
ncbi:MAG: hypothetical protein NC320_13485 [Clostridium sp.]|nr:hypothetical protein [Clostridium sp.]